MELKHKAIINEKPDFHLNLIREICDMINNSSSQDMVLNKVVEKIALSLNFEVVSLYIREEGSDRLVLKATKGLTYNPDDPIIISIEEGLTGMVYRSGRSLIANPASKHPSYKYFPESGEMEYESFVGVPVQSENKRIGVLIAQTSESHRVFSAEETFLEIISDRLAALLEVTDKFSRMHISSEKGSNKVFQGKGVSGGAQLGTAFIIRDDFSNWINSGRKVESVTEEVNRLKHAVNNAKDEIIKLIDTLIEDSSLPESEINIFQAHLLILEGPDLQDKIIARIKNQKLCAESAVIEEVEEISRHFEKSGNAYLMERSHDFRDIGHKILKSLSGDTEGDIQRASVIPEGVILVAHSIRPSLVASLFNSSIGGIVTELGGETSHTVILAQTLGIPAVSGVDKITEKVGVDDKLLLDGKNGFIFVNPENSLINEYREAAKKHSEIRKLLYEAGSYEEELPFNVKLTANVGFPMDYKLAEKAGLKEAGLFRTEFSFMQQSDWPSVEKQTDIYRDVKENFPGNVTIRTLDVGADKLLPYYKFPKEDNPLLGIRSIRFSMENLKLFRDQIEAILNADRGEGKLKVLLPMVSSLWEVETAKEIITELSESRFPGNKLPELGIMAEVPAVGYQIDSYAPLIDFISIGTNDLIQYLLAVDRDSNTVRHLYSGLHPAVLRFLNDILSKCERMNIPVTVCGELAGSPLGAMALLAIGFRSFSVMPSKSFIVKALLKKLNAENLQEICKTILSEHKETNIKHFLQDYLNKVEPLLATII